MLPSLQALLIVASVGLLACGSSDPASPDEDSTGASTPDAPLPQPDTSAPAEQPLDTLDPETRADDAQTPDGQTVSEIDRPEVTAPSDTDSGMCTAGEDCATCTYPSAPSSSDDCYCTFCPSHVMARSTCDANAQAWQRHCTYELWADRISCPVVSCSAPAPVHCAAGLCVEGCDLSTCPDLDGCQRIAPAAEGECCPTCDDAPRVCEGDSGCRDCYYNRIVTSPDGCYCPGCRTTLVDAASCDAYEASWRRHCDPSPDPDDPCPVIACLPDPIPPACDSAGQCVRHWNGCVESWECTGCAFTERPQRPEDCRCPGCPSPTSEAFCESILEAAATVCADFDYSACPDLVCAARTPRCPALGGICELEPQSIPIPRH